LDVTWELPDFKRIELVPCKDLGISIFDYIDCFRLKKLNNMVLLGLMIVPVGGFIVVTKVKDQSVAGEDHKVF
jgi:hypothetical protein